MTSLEKLYVPNNRLSDTGSAKLLQSISEKSVRKMDLGENHVGKQTIDIFAYKLPNK